MRKALIVFVLCTLVCAAAVAGSVEPVSTTGPLYRESLSDPYAFVSKLHVQRVTDPDLRPVYVRTSVWVEDKEGNTVKGIYVNLPYEDDALENPNDYMTYTRMRTALSTSVFRRRIESDGNRPSIDFEFELGGGLNTVFCMVDSSTCIGFDGTWILAPAVRIADRLTLRAGIHHFSGHYGDELLEKFYRQNGFNFTDYGDDEKEMDHCYFTGDFEGRDDEHYNYRLGRLTEYVRDNQVIFGASYDSPKGWRVYSELEVPIIRVWFRPFCDTPNGFFTMEGAELMESIGSKERFTDEQIEAERELRKKGFYLAMRAHVGAEYFYDLSPDRTLFVSGDLQLHQDGQTGHDIGYYKPSNPWEPEISIAAGIQFGRLIPGKSLSIELEYHDGRTSTTDFYFQRTRTVELGFTVK